MVLADGNPNPGVVTFVFGKMAEPKAATRIRLAGTQSVIAVAKLVGGSFIRTSRKVKVTIGGCGGWTPSYNGDIKWLKSNLV